MKVEDVLSKIVDNYNKIIIGVYNKETCSIEGRYEVKPHANYIDIPEEIWEAEVFMMILYFDSLVISVWEVKGE